MEETISSTTCENVDSRCCESSHEFSVRMNGSVTHIKVEPNDDFDATCKTPNFSSSSKGTIENHHEHFILPDDPYATFVPKVDSDLALASATSREACADLDADLCMLSPDAENFDEFSYHQVLEAVSPSKLTPIVSITEPTSVGDGENFTVKLENCGNNFTCETHKMPFGQNEMQLSSETSKPSRALPAENLELRLYASDAISGEHDDSAGCGTSRCPDSHGWMARSSNGHATRGTNEPTEVGCDPMRALEPYSFVSERTQADTRERSRFQRCDESRPVVLKNCVVVLKKLDISNLKAPFNVAQTCVNGQSRSDLCASSASEFGVRLLFCRDGKTHECSYCRKSFRTSSQLQRHEVVHTRARPYVCSLCNKKFTDPSNLKRHEKRFHVGGKAGESHACEIKCENRNDVSEDERFSTYENVQPPGEQASNLSSLKDSRTCENVEEVTEGIKCENVKERSGIGEDKRYQCAYCEKRFRKSYVCKNHERIHTGEKPYECLVCQKRFSNSFRLKLHSFIHTGEKPHQCSYCEKRFYDLRKRRLHERVHTGEKPYECGHCKKKFTDSTQLRIHSFVHTGERTYRCSHCDKKFFSSNILRRHERSHRGVKPHECSYCKKTFYEGSHLKRHERVHTGTAPYRCSFCEKMFFDPSGRERHERIHTGEKPYQCSYCDKKFNVLHHCRNHERIHADEALYKCATCNKAFSDVSHLNAHVFVHSGESPYQCSQCGKKLSTSHSLKRHEKLHSGAKPFECARCDKKFPHISNLRRHEMVHTGERPFQCSRCGKKFWNSGTLKTHTQLHLLGSDVTLETIIDTVCD